MHSEFLPQLGRKPSLDTEQIKKTTRMMRMHDEECNVSHVLVMLTSLLCLVVSLVVRWLYTLLFTQFDLCKVINHKFNGYSFTFYKHGFNL